MRRFLKHPERHGYWYTLLCRIPLATFGFVILALGVAGAFYFSNTGTTRTCHSVEVQRDSLQLIALRSIGAYDPKLAHQLADQRQLPQATLPDKPNPLVLHLIPLKADREQAVDQLLKNLYDLDGAGCPSRPLPPPVEALRALGPHGITVRAHLTSHVPAAP